MLISCLSNNLQECLEEVVFPVEEALQGAVLCEGGRRAGEDVAVLYNPKRVAQAEGHLDVVCAQEDGFV